MFEKKGITLLHAGKNFVDEVWEDKPSLPLEKIWILEEQYSG